MNAEYDNSIPIGAFSFILLYSSIPAHLPYPHSSSVPQISMECVQELDFLGTGLLLAATTLMLTALEQSSVGHSRHSATVLVPFVFAIFLWCAVFGWSKYQSVRDAMQEPILPWRVSLPVIAV